MKLPTEKECLQKAYELCIEVEPESTITENSSLLNEGDVLEEEIIFFKEGIVELIKFCQGK